MRGSVPQFPSSIWFLVKYREPEPGPDVRVDTGVYEGGEISMFYDPMIAKLCSYGKTRTAAIDRMRRALDEFYVRGVSHNVPFLAALMAHPRFVAGNLTTNFIAEEFKGGFRWPICRRAIRRCWLACCRGERIRNARWARRGQPRRHAQSRTIALRCRSGSGVRGLHGDAVRKSRPTGRRRAADDAQVDQQTVVVQIDAWAPAGA
jgi:acetyl/propionyl-CoA carboxylase alpha subunit